MNNYSQIAATLGYELSWNTNKLIRDMFNNLLTDTSQRNKPSCNTNKLITKFKNLFTDTSQRNKLNVYSELRIVNYKVC